MAWARRTWLPGLVFLVLAGRALAAGPAPLAAGGCVGCHGPLGTGSPPIPAIAGRPADEIIAAMRAFAAQGRPNTIMGRIALGYSDAEIAAIAAWFSAQR